MLMNDINIQVDHIYREANQLANFMAYLTAYLDNMQAFHSFRHLPNQAKTILNTDKCQLPSLRIRPGKGIISRDA